MEAIQLSKKIEQNFVLIKIAPKLIFSNDLQKIFLKIILKLKTEEHFKELQVPEPGQSDENFVCKKRGNSFATKNIGIILYDTDITRIKTHPKRTHAI